MRALFIGGTGIISTACTRLAAQNGVDLTLITRGERAVDLPAGVRTIRLDIRDQAEAIRKLEGASFDVVADWIASGDCNRANGGVDRTEARQRRPSPK